MQFFSSLNYQLLPIILNKVGFDKNISWFFSSYLINRQTQYILNYFISFFFKADISMRQRFILSFILSAFYIALIFHMFKKRTKNLLTPILVSILSFVNNRLFVFQEKSYEKFNATLFYNIISSLFNQFNLVIEHDKSKVFYFSRSTKNVNLPLLYLRYLEGFLLKLRDI